MWRLEAWADKSTMAVANRQSCERTAIGEGDIFEMRISVCRFEKIDRLEGNRRMSIIVWTPGLLGFLYVSVTDSRELRRPDPAKKMELIIWVIRSTYYLGGASDFFGPGAAAPPAHPQGRP
jgi:hypothetical protein